MRCPPLCIYLLYVRLEDQPLAFWKLSMKSQSA